MTKLCLGCMQPKQNSPVCKLCGFDERQDNLPHQLPVGTLLRNQYLVGKVLGQGGFGITYIGWDQHLSSPVAIKEYFPGGVVQRNTRWSTDVMCVNGESPALFVKHRERFLKEARTLAQLAHLPQIVQVKSFFTANDTAYIVMEYVQGITLKEYLKKLGRPMTEPEALSVMRPVLDALSKVHEHGLIHRDISPDNIMLTADGGIKLIDFGTVRYIDDSGNSRSTETVLKPGFAPMEQYSSRGNLGTWTDVYAVSATFHYLLTGKVPRDVHARMNANEQLTLLEETPGLSRRLKYALAQGMQLRPAERTQTIGQLHRMLFSDDYAVPEMPAQKTVSAPKKKSPRLLIAVIMLVLITGGWSLTRFLPDARPAPASPVQTQPEAATESYPAATLPQEDPAAEAQYALAVSLEEADQTAEAAIAFGKIPAYKDSEERAYALWSTVADRDTIAADVWHTVGIRSDGTMVRTGINRYGEGDLESWTDIIAVSISSLDAESYGATLGHTVGLRSDGTVLAAGNNEYGQCHVADWRNIVAVSTNPYTTVGLKADGTAVITGAHREAWQEVLSWTDLISLQAGADHIVGLKLDGTVLSAGSDEYGQCQVSHWEKICRLSASEHHTIGITDTGTPVIAGTNNFYTQPNLSSWNRITDISASRHVIGLRSDGTVTASGYDEVGVCHVQSWQQIAAISTGLYHTVGLRSDGTVVATGWNQHERCSVSGWTDMMLPKTK